MEEISFLDVGEHLKCIVPSCDRWAVEHSNHCRRHWLDHRNNSNASSESRDLLAGKVLRSSRKAANDETPAKSQLQAAIEGLMAEGEPNPALLRTDVRSRKKTMPHLSIGCRSGSGSRGHFGAKRWHLASGYAKSSFSSGGSSQSLSGFAR
jgi:hypothetical protein